MKNSNKILIVAFLLLITLLSNLSIPVKAAPPETKDRPIIETTNLQKLEILIKECGDRMTAAHDMAESARALDYEEDNEIILLAKQEYNLASEQKAYYMEIFDRQYWGEKEKEFPVATYIWRFLKDKGYNNYICAGILGNIMAEVGGQTLNIQPYLGNGSYYGICQWSLYYYPSAANLGLGAQCNLLSSSIVYQLDTYGFCYKQGFNYSSFLLLEDEKEAALAFAKCYERCASSSYYTRQKNATIALEYFTEE